MNFPAHDTIQLPLPTGEAIAPPCPSEAPGPALAASPPESPPPAAARPDYWEILVLATMR